MRTHNHPTMIELSTQKNDLNMRVKLNKAKLKLKDFKNSFLLLLSFPSKTNKTAELKARTLRMEDPIIEAN